MSRYDYDQEEPPPEDNGWKFAAVVAISCAVGFLLTLIVTALVRYA